MPSLPWENIWVPIARALTEDSDDAYDPLITDEDVRWLLGKADAYVVEDLGPGGRSVYRRFHALLAAHLRGEQNTEHDGDNLRPPAPGSSAARLSANRAPPTAGDPCGA